MPPKRKAVDDTQDPPPNRLGEPSDSAADELNPRAARRTRRPTVKQALLLQDKRDSLDKEYKELQDRLQVLKKSAKKLAQEPDPEDDEDVDADAATLSELDLDLESEEEDADVVREREHRSKFQSRGLFPAPLSAGQRHLRREGEKASALGAATTNSGGEDSTTGTQSTSSATLTPRLAIMPTSLSSSAATTHSPRLAMHDFDNTPSSPAHPLAAGFTATSQARSTSSHSHSTSLPSVNEDARGRSSQPHPHSSLSGRQRDRSPGPARRTPSRSPARYRDRLHERRRTPSQSPVQQNHSPERHRLRSPRHDRRSRSPSDYRHHPSDRLPDLPRSERSSSRTSTTTSRTTSSSGRATPSSGTSDALIVADPGCVPLPAPFKNGKAPSGKPKARDYEPRAAKLINHACHQYEVLLATDQPFPDPGVSVGWATRVWADVCKAAQVNYTLSSNIERIITARASHARGVLRDKLRPLVAQTYGFLADGSERSKVKNIARYTFLLDRDTLTPEPRFHYRDVEAKEGFAQNKLITMLIKAQWFADTGAPGIKYSAQFSPLREVTLAFIFTTIEFCLDQWATGNYDKNITYADKVYRPKYEVHLTHVREWCDIDRDATSTIRQRMYDRARRSSGAPPETKAVSGLSEDSRNRLRLEILAQAAAQHSGDDDD